MTDVVIPIAPSSKNGRDEARSRKKKSDKQAPSSNGSGVHSDGGESRAQRLAVRRKRVANARARKKTGWGNMISVFLMACGIFAIYALTCMVFFRSLSGKSGSTVSKIRGLIKKDQIENPPVPSGIPIGIWPVSIRDEDGNFEEIKHPGYEDGHVTMTVPRFWADDPVAIHENKLMSRERALSIGTCVTVDPKTGTYTRGDACPVSERTIFVAIASYRDWQCRDTVTSIFSAAAHPDRIRVAVVDQIIAGEDGSCDAPHSPCSEDPSQPICKYKSQIDVYQMDAQLAVGPVFARHVGHRLYRGEYYAMQSDAHVTFTRGWDGDIIAQIEATGDEMAVLSTYLTDIEGSIDPNTGLSLRHTRPIMCNTEYEGGQQGKHLRHLAQPECMPLIKGMPQLQPYWAAGFSFSRGHFVATTPYDQYQPMIFQGEEMSITLRGFTIGYDFFAPEKSVCFHSYAKGANEAARNKVPHFWENSGRYEGTGIKAMKRLLGIVHMNPEVNPSEWNHSEEEKYGLGGARTTTKFYETFGIDVVKKTTERHLCQFVRNKMHDMFMPHLRPDGIGIDYSEIDFKWKDPRPNDP
mmetsp:Transcript_4317/g.9174  ORF Transcript_4317/g.9174 Transcript_4317/m.9174 type:complete len:579 (+) Transcript_4317:32-1768(+)